MLLWNSTSCNRWAPGAGCKHWANVHGFQRGRDRVLITGSNVAVAGTDVRTVRLCGKSQQRLSESVVELVANIPVRLVVEQIIEVLKISPNSVPGKTMEVL